MKKKKVIKQRGVSHHLGGSRKSTRLPIKERRINYLAITMGLMCIILFVIAVRYNLQTKEIIEKGQHIRTPIVSISASRAGRTMEVMIDKKILSVGQSSYARVGDTISVLYSNDKSRAVLDTFTPKAVYIFIALWCILLVLGLVLLIGGFFPELENISFFKRKRRNLIKK